MILIRIFTGVKVKPQLEYFSYQSDCNVMSKQLTAGYIKQYNKSQNRIEYFPRFGHLFLIFPN